MGRSMKKGVVGRGMTCDVTEIDGSDRGSEKNETRFTSYVQNKFPKDLRFSRL
jgi:hypothetical protein